MAVNRELSIALGLDESGFVSGAKNAEQAAQGFEGELEAIVRAAEAVDVAMEKMDGANLSELTQKAGEAKFRIQELEKSTEALTRAGLEIPTKLTAKIQEYGQRTQEAALKGEQFKRSLAETTREAQAGASGFEKITLKGQGYGGILTQLNNESNKLTSKLGQMGPLIGAVTGAFTAGYAIGQKIKENWDDIAKAMDKIIPGSKKVADAMKGMGRDITDAMAKVVTGVDGAGDAFDRTGAKVLSHLAKQARLKDALEGVDQAFAAAIPEVLAYQQAQAEVTEQIKKLEEGLDKAAKIQGGDYNKSIEKSAAGLVEWYEKLSDANKALVESNPRVAEAVKHSKEFLEAQGQLSKGLGETTQAIKDQAAATDEALRSMARWGDALRGTKQAGAESTESIKERAKAEAERAAANTQSVLDRMKAEDEERAKKDSETRAQKEAEDTERRIAAEKRLTESIRARTEAIAEAEAVTAAQNEALRQMATYVDQLNGSIYDGIPAMESFFAYFDRFADSKLYGGYLNEIGNSMKDGTRSIEEGIAALEELKLGLDKIGAMGGGWLGDVLTEISGLVTQLNRAADAARQAKRDAMWDNSAEDQTGPAGEQRTVGFAAGRSSGAGAIGRITAELNRTRNP